MKNNSFWGAVNTGSRDYINFSNDDGRKKWAEAGGSPIDNLILV